MACRPGHAAPRAGGEAGDVEWNFGKFPVGPDGTVIARFRPQVTPEGPGSPGQASAPGPRFAIWPAMIARWTSLVPSQIRSTRSSRKKRSATFSRI